MGLACFKCQKSCSLTDNIHLYGIISNKYEYLKPRETISMEYDVDTVSCILRIFLDKFLKETIEIQSLSESKVALVGRKCFLNNVEV